MDEISRTHLQRLRMATVSRLQRKDLAEWVTTHTYLNGRKFSTKGHEYQDRIMRDESGDITIKKSAQIGISEMSMRMALGFVSIMPNFSAIYTMPTAGLSSVYTKTRLDPIIEGSPFLRNAVSTDIDSAEVKQLGTNNFLYLKGAAAGNAAISVSADLLLHDELSFSDPTVIESYSSRLIHSPYKWRIKLSTPTYPGDAIDKSFQASRRYYNFAKCDHCGHFWLPDYYNDVKIPGFTGELQSITRDNLHGVRYEEAQLHCPHCGLVPDLGPEHREWVRENPDENHDGVGYSLSPFDCPSFISAPSLILASTKYASKAKFEQFHLGRCAEDKESGITPEDVEKAFVQMDTSPFHTHILGADMGLVCRLFVAGVTNAGQLMIVHSEQIPVGQFRARYAALSRQYRCTAKVLDAQPYVETVLSLQDHDPNLFAGYFVKKKGLDLYDTISREENEERGRTALRQVSINKNAVLDVLLDDLRNGKILIRESSLNDDIKKQLTAMKRVKQHTDDGMQFIWSKPADGEDHFHHALLYVWLAAQIRGAARAGFDSPPFVGSFRMKAPPAQRTGTGMRG